jgi:hypothetical protein
MNDPEGMSGESRAAQVPATQQTPEPQPTPPALPFAPPPPSAEVPVPAEEGPVDHAARPSVPTYPPPPPSVPSAIYVERASANGFAIASLVLGILWIYWIGSILALIFGYVGKGQIDRAGGHQTGRGMAIAGIVLGWIGVGILLLLIVLGIGVGLSA